MPELKDAFYYSDGQRLQRAVIKQSIKCSVERIHANTCTQRAASQECSYFPSKLPSVEGAGRICNTDSKCQAGLLHCHRNKCYRTVLDSRSTQLLMRKKSNELNSVVSIPAFMSLFLFFGSKVHQGFQSQGKIDMQSLELCFLFVCDCFPLAVIQNVLSS